MIDARARRSLVTLLNSGSASLGGASSRSFDTVRGVPFDWAQGVDFPQFLLGYRTKDDQLPGFPNRGAARQTPAGPAPGGSPDSADSRPVAVSFVVFGLALGSNAGRVYISRHVTTAADYSARNFRWSVATLSGAR